MPQSLFERGYRVRADLSKPRGNFLVTNPSGQVYPIDACEGLCSCWGHRRNGHCKHLDGGALAQLVIDQWCSNERDDDAYEQGMYDLLHRSVTE
jgi:hypothetical protein